MCCLSLSVAGQNPTYDFLRQDVSARASSMAGSYVSMTGEPSSLFYNPSSIGVLESPLAAFGYTSHLLDINAGFAAVASSVEDIGVVGFGVNYINYGSFDGRTESGDATGTFGAGDIAISLSVARELEENIYYGISGKFIYSSIADVTSSALAADIGILYVIPGNNPVTLGASLTNIGTQLDPYGSVREPLPVELTIGGTIKPQHLPLQLSINFHKLNESQDAVIDHFNAFSVGGEFTLSKALRFRFGYNNEQRKELKIGSSAGSAGFSLGSGLMMKYWQVDYSINSLGKIGSINRISIGINI